MIATAFLSGGQRVYGTFHPSQGGPAHSTVLLLHGFPGNEEDVLGIGRTLSRRGVQTLSFNYRGTYRSDGRFSLANSLGDVAAAWNHLHGGELPGTRGIDPGRTVLGGYSFGGGMALSHADRHPEVTRVFTVAATDHGAFARRYRDDAGFRAMIDDIFAELEAPNGPVRSERRDLRELLDDPDRYDLQLSAPRLSDRDLLLIGGWEDSNNTIEENLLPLYRSLRRAGAEGVRIATLHDDHGFGAVREALADTVHAWLHGDA